MTRYKFLIAGFAATYMLIFSTGSALAQSLDPDPPLTIVMNHLANAQAYSNKTSYPRTTNPDGTIKRVSASDWTSGFLPGSLWLMYEYTKDDTWLTRAQQWTAGLEGQKNNKSTHDVGFIIYSSFGAGYRLTQNDTYKSIILQAANSLSSRYNPVVGCIKSWDNNPNYTFPVIIDNMVNLEILFWATKVTGDSSYYRIAFQHALTTLANHFRPDNSSYHVVDYNPTTGNIISKTTSQGLNNLSDWARGQAWGLYGFTMCYRETGDTRFLDMAKKIADFFINHPNLPLDYIPFWDFDAFDYRDASAAAISSAAFLELGEYLPGSTSYYNFGLSVLNTLSSSAYSAAVGTNNNFILQHGVGNKPKNTEVDKPLIYADYFYTQALMRHKKPAPIVTATSGGNEVLLQWNKSTGASKYKIKRSLVQGGPYTTIDSNIIATSHVNSGLNGGTTYYYIVISCNATGEGGASVEVSGTPTAQPAQFRITGSIDGNGVVNKSPDQNTYSSGTLVTLTATPLAGYQFSGWSGDVNTSANPITITMDGDKTISATFTQVAAQYSLNISVKGNGTVLKNPDQSTYTNGSNITLTATPSAGQQFAGWSGDVSSTANPLALTINADKTITANFNVLPGLISNITSKSGRQYAIGQLSVGMRLYTDRNYVATSVPSSLNNAPFIQTPNDDKTNKSTSLVSFTLGQSSTIYIGYDPRGNKRPSWMSSWKKVSGKTIGINDPDISYLVLYSKVFSAGKVALGGNLASPAKGAKSNYIVVVVPLQSPTTQNVRNTNVEIQNSLRVINQAETDSQGQGITQGFKIYPNPNKGTAFFLVANNFAPDEIVTIVLYDVSGKIIQSTRINADASGRLSRLISIYGKLSKGNYIIKTTSLSQILTQMLVVD